jgi:hypothetical protein
LGLNGTAKAVPFHEIRYFAGTPLSNFPVYTDFL